MPDVVSSDPTSPPARAPSFAVRLLRSRGLRGLLLICVTGWALVSGLEALGGPEAMRERLGPGAAFVLIPAHAIVAVTPFPSEVVALVYGAVYGFALGWPLIWAGWLLGAFLEYAIFRRIASDLGNRDGDRLPRWLRRLPVHHPLFLIGGRLVPFGNHAVNVMAGSRRVPFGRFAWASALAFLPFSAFVAALANGLVQR
jgi:uncharacterized membrane protein YdjX (TVP38/TMEM64 family)